MRGLDHCLGRRGEQLSHARYPIQLQNVGDGKLRGWESDGLCCCKGGGAGRQGGSGGELEGARDRG